MCERRKGEAWASYAFRQVCEQPRAVLTCIGLVAAGVLYCDMRSMFHEQTEVNKSIATQISELNVRMEHIEHKLEK